MKLTKGRLAFVLLGLVAIVLLGIMIGLQLLIIGHQDQPAAVETPVVQAQQAPTTVKLALATSVPSPTVTPIPPTPEPPTPIPPTPIPPTPEPPTPEPPTPIPPTPEPPTFTPEPPPATALPPTPELPTAAPATSVAIAAATAPPATATVAPTPAPTNTPALPADLRLGYTERSPDCKLVTEIVQLALERQMGLRIATLHFKTADDLFAALAATTGNDKIDLTLCYIDPQDRTYLGSYGSSLRFLDGNYGESDKKKLYAVINSALISPLKATKPCLHSFLTKLDFGDMQFQTQDAAQWLDKNSALISTWSQCP